MPIDWCEAIDQATPTRFLGRVVETSGTSIAVADLPVPIGAAVEISREVGPAIDGEVIGFRDRLTIVFPLGNIAGVRRGSSVRLVRTVRSMRVGDGLLGRVVNAQGRCIDGRPQPALSACRRLDGDGPAAVDRPRIEQPLGTGIRAIDAMLTCGRGQRLGIFSGSGVGKSVLLGMMARYTSADVNVVVLVGERGREVNDFIERDLGPEGLAKSVLVVATSDEPAVMRVQAAASATTIAEYFRDQGKDVLLLVDSLSRLALAQREIGLAAGEPPTTRGYPPSVFALLPRLVERAGRNPLGSITAFYTVLVEGDDENEPIADAVRGLLDGHCWLSRELAGRGHYPAIDVIGSLSRLMSEIVEKEHREAARLVRQLLGAYREHSDLISIGAYRKGANREVDTAIDMREAIEDFLRQETAEHAQLESTCTQLMALASKCRAKLTSGPLTAAVAGAGARSPASPDIQAGPSTTPLSSVQAMSG